MVAAFRGWIKTSLIEYPGRVSTVVFTDGCNLRCPYCHNADLVLRPEVLPEIAAREVLGWVDARSGIISALVVSGGEPTLKSWLGDFLRDVRTRGLLIAISTNGTNPDRLAALLESGLLDYVAMDVKTLPVPELYAAAAGADDPSIAGRVRESIALLARSTVDYELRCTVVPHLHTPEVIAALAAELAGARRLVLQEFRSATTLDPRYRGLAPYPPAEMRALCEAAAAWIPDCSVRYAAPPPAPSQRPMPLPARAGGLAQTADSGAQERRYSIQVPHNVVQ